MSIFKKIGQAIAQAFVSLFNAAKRAYKNLDPESQKALQMGTGLIHLINEMTEDTAEDILTAIKEKFPDVPVALIESALFQVAQQFGLNKDVDDLEEAIDHLKTKLASLDGKVWAAVSHSMASVLAAIFAPEQRVAVIVSLIEWVYQNFIKRST
jgi:hypothetical protein